MSDHRDDDAQFREWMNNRPPRDEDEDVPASVTFMEMMRRTAARQERANAPLPRVEPTPDPNDPIDPTPDPSPNSGRGEKTPNDLPSPRLRGRGVGGEGESQNTADPTQGMQPMSAPSPEFGGGSGRGSKDRGGNDDDGSPARKPRRAKRGRRTISTIGSFLRSIIVVVVAAGLMATIFTWWTPNAFISDGVRAELSIAMATDAATPIPTNLPTPNWAQRIGVVSGHRGPENDPGAVCDDGLTEAEINFAVAQSVVASLRGMGYTVDLLDEFDPRLQNYQAVALVSIHSNTCQDWNGEIVSGYLISAAAARISARGNDDVLVECIAETYELASGLERRTGVTVDMTDYHTFREIHPLTPAAILELGFMRADREVLTERQEELARGITDGVLCFLN